MPKFEDICSIVTGQIMPRVEAKAQDTIVSTVMLITPKAIENGAVQISELTKTALKKTPDESKLVHKGDIVLKLSTPYSAALITDDVDGCMASSFCAIIRNTGPDYDSRFLVSYLNTRYVREQLRRTTIGSTVPLLRITDLKTLEIPQMDPLKCQDAIHALEVNQKKKAVLKELLDTCDAYDESIVMSAIGDFEQ